MGSSLLSYSSPTDDAEPTGSVIVEAHYEKDYTEAGIIALSIIIGLPFPVMIAILVSVTLNKSILTKM